ncbi:hypothetical protein [Salibacterium sp. K-3]
MEQKQKTIEFNGQNYVLAHPGAFWYLEITDECRGANGTLQQAPYFEALLKNVVVEPGVKIEDFKHDIKGLQEFVKEIESFLGERS